MFDISLLKEPLEEAIEEMLRAADRSISWHIPDRNDPALKHQGEGSRRLYQQLPGLYESAITELSDNVDLSDDPASTGRFRLLLHEDNTFEYTWKLLRSGKALMKYNLQITGDWSKAVMNRDLLGNEDQHLSLKARKLRFKRSSDYDKENKSWNITLKSLTRNGSDWVSTAEVEKENCVPAFIFSFLYKENGSLHSFGVLAGLTKRLGNKLGSPLDVMTDQWLPKKSVVLIPTRRIGGSPAREFNPYRCTKTAPHLHSVASSLRTCLDGMLPDNLRNDPAAFRQHLEAQKSRLQQEKNSWRFGLNYLFETLKQHKEWYSRNQQYVQLNKDLKRAEAHVTSIRSLLSETVCKLELEAGLREAELEGRVGAYKIMFEVTRIISKLSRPLVKLQILKPSDSSISIYCDTFVIDIALSQGEGLLESASLTTVQKDQFKQYPKRDDELMHSLKLLAAGDSSDFMEKVERLINRAELAVKHTDVNLEQLEEDVFAKLSRLSKTQYWDVKRAVDGIQLQFRDPFCCLAVFERPKKRTRFDDVSKNFDNMNSTSADSNDGTITPSNRKGTSTSSPENALDHGEWSCTISFIEWNGEVAFHFSGDRPLFMVGGQARRLATEALGSTTENEINVLDETVYNQFLNWTDLNGKKAVVPLLYFSGDSSQCFVCPSASDAAMQQEFILTTREISDGLQVESFPLLVTNTTETNLASILETVSQNLFFHSVLLSMFGSPNTLFGHRVSQMDDRVIRAMFRVDVQAPHQVTLKTSDFLTPGKHFLIDFHLKSDMTIDTNIKFNEPADSPKGSETPADEAESTIEQQRQCSPDLECLNSILQKMAFACHSVPLLLYHAMVKVRDGQLKESMMSTLLERETSIEEMQETLTPRTLDTEEFEDADLSASIKLEGEEAILDDMMY